MNNDFKINLRLKYSGGYFTGDVALCYVGVKKFFPHINSTAISITASSKRFVGAVKLHAHTELDFDSICLHRSGEIQEVYGARQLVEKGWPENYVGHVWVRVDEIL